MKKRILFLLITLFSTLQMSAQSYYEGESIITESGITYICKHIPNFIEIYNSSNLKKTFKDGEILYPGYDIATMNNPDIGSQIIREILGDTLVQRLKDKYEMLALSFILDTNGEIKEILFRFPDDSPFIETAPDIFCELEQQLKDNLTFTFKEDITAYNVINIDFLIRFAISTSLMQSYYENDSVVSKNGITYTSKKHKLRFIDLYLSSNQFEDMKMVYIDGTYYDALSELQASASKIVTPNNNQDVEDKIIRQVFGETFIRTLMDEDELLIIGSTIGEDGKITEMSFTFTDDSEFMGVTPDVFYEIEQQIKSATTYTLNEEEASRYNIIKIEWPIHFGYFNRTPQELLFESRRYFEELMNEAIKKNVIEQRGLWPPSKFTPLWSDPHFKNDKKYDYIMFPVLAQNEHIAVRKIVENDTVIHHNVPIFQLLCIRRRNSGRYDSAYISLIPERGYYEELKDKVLDKFLEAEGFQGDFSGIIAYNNPVNFMQMATEKFENGISKMYLAPGPQVTREALDEGHRKMFKDITILQVIRENRKFNF